MYQRDPRAVRDGAKFRQRTTDGILQGLFLGGQRVSGQEIRDQNGSYCSGTRRALLTRMRSHGVPDRVKRIEIISRTCRVSHARAEDIRSLAQTRQDAGGQRRRCHDHQ